jgi:Mor family transcriptional regulator
MVIHKKTRLAPIQRKALLVDDYFKHHIRVCDLSRKYQVSRPIVYKIIHRAEKRTIASIEASTRNIGVSY